jgi:hypothetical protein
MKRFFLLILFLFFCVMTLLFSQTKAGIAIYATGTETGLGYRSAKESKFAFDLRACKVNFTGTPARGSFVSESSLICRVYKAEKLRFHLGLGFRGSWQHKTGLQNEYGAVIPIGIEAFPFPFQQAGLFFETAPYYTAYKSSWSAGIRTTAGFVFYFPEKTTSSNQNP